MTPLVVFTIGHSTRTSEDFIRLLKAHGVLHRARLHYTHMPGLGGLRRARRDSSNTAWRNASFRGYADYMQTPAFEEALNRCIALATRERVVLMCAEAVPRRCHRSLIADALLARGIDAREIASGVRARPHSLTQFARVAGARVTYPAARRSRGRRQRLGDDRADQRLDTEGRRTDRGVGVWEDR